MVSLLQGSVIDTHENGDPPRWIAIAGSVQGISGTKRKQQDGNSDNQAAFFSFADSSWSTSSALFRIKSG